MSNSSSPFQDLLSILEQLPEMDTCGARKSLEKLAEKPFVVEDDLCELRHWLAGWQGTDTPSINEAHICLLASSYDGGTTAETIKSYISDTSKGRAPVNLMCVDRGIGLRVLELAPEIPHVPGVDGELWQEKDCMGSVAFGMEAAAAGGNLLGLSDITLGDDEYAYALLCSVLGCSVDELGFHEELAAKVKERIKAAGDDASPLALLQLLGGREVAAMIGGIIAARSRRIPVLLDGISALAAFAVLHSLDSNYVAHCRLASYKRPQDRVLGAKMGIKPVLHYTVNTGPGCGVALACQILHGSVLLDQMPDKI